MVSPVTGNLLSGSAQRPDIITLVECTSSGTATRSGVCILNKLGYIPGVSTITGLGRSLLGIVHTIAHLACAIFSKNRWGHLQEAGIGFKNIVRGVIEAIPIIGNITIGAIDCCRA